jgi:PAS domain S-box-containing protein
MLGPSDAQRSLDELFEDANDAVFVTDPGEDRILDANAAASRLLGYTREEFMVTPISQIHPHELPRMRAFLEVALRDGVNWTIEMACRTKSGTFLPTEIGPAGAR